MRKGKSSIPVVREELVVGKRVVETGKGVRVAKTVSERSHLVDEPLVRNDVVVERVSVANAPGIRYEGATMIVPEVLFVEKRTVLKEELRITPARREVRKPQRVVLRSEQVSVEPFDEKQ